MPSVTIKNIPEKTLKRLRDRAKGNHRSLQGELLYTLESSAMQATVAAEGDVWEVLRMAKALGGPSESSVRLIRDDRENH